MPAQEEGSNPQTRNVGRSIFAVVLGIVVVFVLSSGTDAIMHKTGIFPPYNLPMTDPGLYALALGYRCVYGVIAGYVTARFAPNTPVRHALILGVIGLVLSTVGAVAMWNVGANWYPVALAISAIPTAWLGGVIYNS